MLSVRISGRKVLSAWPAGPRMRKQWFFKKKHFKLARGRYTWYVWPGLGKRSARNYGKLFGKSDFHRLALTAPRPLGQVWGRRG